MEKVIIFTDGAAKGNPGPGGYGVVIVYASKVVELGAKTANTTNNEMELKAVVEALKFVSRDYSAAEIYSDSKYVIQGATAWIFNWLKNNWKTKANTDVSNKELWLELLPLLKKVKVTWHKVPGHVGIVGNERADTIASDLAENKVVNLYNGDRDSYGYDIANTEYDKAKATQRSAARKRQSQKAYSYLSKVDGVVQTHQTWSECEARVKGIKGARFKKSVNATEEAEIIKDFNK